MTEDIEIRIEALKLIKEWSSGLLFVQSAAIGVVGTMLTVAPIGWSLAVAIALFAALIFSIYIGAVCVVGTIPYIVQNLSTNPTCDIYSQRGGLKEKWWRIRNLGEFCLLQAHLFVVSLVLFAVFAIFRGFG